MNIWKIAQNNNQDDYRGLRILLREFDIKDINSILGPAILDIFASRGKKQVGQYDTRIKILDFGKLICGNRMKIYKIAQELTFYHGTNNIIDGDFRLSQNDPGWFGRGVYVTSYPEHAKIYGKYVYKVSVNCNKFAEVIVSDNYKKAIYVGDAKIANEKASGNKNFLQNDFEWSNLFSDNLKGMGYCGIKITLNGKPNAEVVIFDPSDVIFGERI